MQTKANIGVGVHCCVEPCALCIGSFGAANRPNYRSLERVHVKLLDVSLVHNYLRREFTCAASVECEFADVGNGCVVRIFCTISDSRELSDFVPSALISGCKGMKGLGKTKRQESNAECLMRNSVFFEHEFPQINHEFSLIFYVDE